MRDLRKLRTKYEIRLDNRQIAFLIIGAMAALAIMFTLGVWIGKGLGQMQAQSMTPTPMAADPTPSEPDPLSLASTFTEEPTPMDMFGEPTPEEIGEPTPGLDESPTPEIIEPTPTDGEFTPTPSPADLAPAVEQTPTEDQIAFGALPGPPPGGDFWTVQIGSYPTMEEAQQMYQRLTAKGNRTFIEKADLGERGMWFRVSVGQYATEAGAKAMASALRERENLDDTWVRYVP